MPSTQKNQAVAFFGGGYTALTKQQEKQKNICIIRNGTIYLSGDVVIYYFLMALIWPHLIYYLLLPYGGTNCAF